MFFIYLKVTNKQGVPEVSIIHFSYDKVVAKRELRSVMLKYQMMAIQKNMGNEIHSPQSNVNYINFVSRPVTPNWCHLRNTEE